VGVGGGEEILMGRGGLGVGGWGEGQCFNRKTVHVGAGHDHLFRERSEYGEGDSGGESQILNEIDGRGLSNGCKKNSRLIMRSKTKKDGRGRSSDEPNLGGCGEHSPIGGVKNAERAKFGRVNRGKKNCSVGMDEYFEFAGSDLKN
jgi:hypothetical protein